MLDNRRVLGVMGGLGPLATAHFMELVFRMTDADTDQQHLPMIVYNMPFIPDRTAYILDNTKDDPLPEMLKIGKTLQEQGADHLVIPCMTAHYFADALSQQLDVPLIHGIRETAAHLKANGIRKAGILATDGTVGSGIFHRELEAQGITALAPDAAAQAHVMYLIFENVKAGKPLEMDRFSAAAQELRSQGAEVIILGCTELSLVKRDQPIGAGFVDAMEVLARQSLLACGKQIKPEFDCLITR